MRYFSKHSGMAPRCSLSGSEGFTLVELIVVITIMVAMMALAASMLRGGGRGQGLQAAVEWWTAWCRRRGWMPWAKERGAA